MNENPENDSSRVEDFRRAIKSGDTVTAMRAALTAELTAGHIECFDSWAEESVVKAIFRNPTLTDELAERLIVAGVGLLAGKIFLDWKTGEYILTAAVDAGRTIPSWVVNVVIRMQNPKWWTYITMVSLNALCAIGDGLPPDTWTWLVGMYRDDQNALITLIRNPRTPPHVLDIIEKASDNSDVREGLEKRRAGIQFCYGPTSGLYAANEGPAETYCPFCGQHDEPCQHLLLIMDGSECCGGTLDEINYYGEFDLIARERFYKAYTEGKLNGYSWKNPTIEELWLGSRESLLKKPESEDYVDVDPYILPRIVMEICDKLGAMQAVSSIERGPGFSSSYIIYYHEDAEGIVKTVLSEFEKMFDEGMIPASS